MSHTIDGVKRHEMKTRSSVIQNTFSSVGNCENSISFGGKWWKLHFLWWEYVGIDYWIYRNGKIQGKN